MSIPQLALIPPKPKLKTPVQRRTDLCGSCNRPIDRVTGECSGCSE